MNSKNAFTLVEVLIALAVLVSGIVFVFRSFTVSLAAVQVFQDTALACLLAEDKMLEIEENDSISIIDSDSGSEIFQGKKFDWSYSMATNASVFALKNFDFAVSWQGRRGEGKHGFKLFTYLMNE